MSLTYWEVLDPGAKKLILLMTLCVNLATLGREFWLFAFGFSCWLLIYDQH